jgi:hypothetical protein
MRPAQKPSATPSPKKSHGIGEAMKATTTPTIPQRAKSFMFVFG